MTKQEIKKAAKSYFESLTLGSRFPISESIPNAFIACAKWMKEKDKTMPNGSAKIVFNEFWEQIKDNKCARQTLASLAFDAGHSLRHKEEDQDDWISVEDGLPEFGIKVLVFGEQKGLNPQMGGAYQHVSKRQDLSHMQGKFHGLRDRNDKNGFVNMSYVTHWQPLPTPPKEREDKDER